METELPFSSPGEIISFMTEINEHLSGVKIKNIAPGEIISFKTEINELLSGFKNPKISNVLSDILSLTLSEGNLEPLVPFPHMKVYTKPSVLESSLLQAVGE